MASPQHRGEGPAMTTVQQGGEGHADNGGGDAAGGTEARPSHSKDREWLPVHTNDREGPATARAERGASDNDDSDDKRGQARPRR